MTREDLQAMQDRDPIDEFLTQCPMSKGGNYIKTTPHGIARATGLSLKRVHAVLERMDRYGIIVWHRPRGALSWTEKGKARDRQASSDNAVRGEVAKEARTSSEVPSLSRHRRPSRVAKRPAGRRQVIRLPRPDTSQPH